jgi:hypothetical protein
MKILAAMLATLLLSACTMFGMRSGTEEPDYRIEDTPGESLQVRTYSPRVAAEAVVEATDEEAGRSAAFQLLFDYISGANQVREKIEMTAPVQVDRASQKIDMTVPVESRAVGEGRFAMRFFLPSSFTTGTAPQPTDPRVRIISVPAETLAVLRFSGSRSEAAVEDRKAELLKRLESTRWQPAGSPTGWFYDPPWTLPPLRRNEVVVPVILRQPGA